MADTSNPTIDPKTTAGNIVKGIQDKAGGKPNASQSAGSAAPVAVDPNAGKEKYVVEGKEVWLSPDQARAYVQKGIAFEPRMDELARARQEMLLMERALTQNPEMVLLNISKKTGVPIQTLVARIVESNMASDEVKEAVGQIYYKKAVRPLKMSPEELKAEQDAEWRTDRERRDKETAENTIKQENAQRVQMALGQIKAQIGEAMKNSGLPNNDSALGAFMARRCADIMRLGYFQRQAVTPTEAIERVKSEMKGIQSAYYDHLDGEALVKELGEANAEKVKKYFLKIVKDADRQIPGNQGKPYIPRKGDRKTMNLDQFHDELAELKKKG